MKEHISEEKLQEWIFEAVEIPVEWKLHINGCEDCKTKILQYQELSGQLSEMPAEEFDFNLVQAVMPAIEKRGSFHFSDNLVWVAVAAIFIVFIILKGSVAADLFVQWFKTLSDVQLALMMVPLCLAALLQVWDSTSRYKRKIDQINKI